VPHLKPKPFDSNEVFPYFFRVVFSHDTLLLSGSCACCNYHWWPVFSMQLVKSPDV